MALISIDTPRHALVTGGSRGIGRAVALALVEMGCPVTINYASNAAKAAEVVAEIAGKGGTATAIAADVSKESEVARLVSGARAAHGPIGILVNNAGIAVKREVFTNTAADFDETFSTNVRSAFLVTQAVVGDMREMKWGRLIFLSSTAAMTGGIFSATYAGSKAALEGMMHHYAAFLMPHNITANAIAPAFIETEMIKGGAPPPLAQMPFGRMGTADEVAMLAQAIVSCGFMTGQTIQINAGRYMT